MVFLTSNPALAGLAEDARRASRVVALTPTATKNKVLADFADHLVKAAPAILAANEEDIRQAEKVGLDETSIDRLRLDRHRISGMADGLRTVAQLDDPVGERVDGWTRPNGLRVDRVRVPLGVVGIIYENRPNVTSDAFGLCLKSGNAVLLRGSSSALRSNSAIVDVAQRSLVRCGLPAGAIGFVRDISRETAVEFMQLRGGIDCLIPRGGEALIASVLEHATVPFVIDGAGNCHVYIDAQADMDMAVAITVNAKIQRPGVCNAMETLLVHEDIAGGFLPRVAKELRGVELVADSPARRILITVREDVEIEDERAPTGRRTVRQPLEIGLATERDFATEFLGMKLAIGVVANIDRAIDHINRFGTGHSEAIVTDDGDAADRFVREVDAAAVLVNASTRFIDGGELGLGGEIGISTQKLHARGPMGLRDLTCVKWVVHGDGQVRS